MQRLYGPVQQKAYLVEEPEMPEVKKRRRCLKIYIRILNKRT